jgi:transposase
MARFMRTTSGRAPAYNVQTAVDAEHALIVAQQVTDEANDTRCLQPMAEAAQAAVAEPGRVLNVVADAGYSSGEQAEACEAKGIVPHVPANRAVNNSGRWHVVRPQGVYLPARHGHLPVPGGTDAHPQAAIAERSCRNLCRCRGGVRSLSAEVALYQFLPLLDHTSPARRGTESHARTGHAGGYAAAAVDGGTPVRHPEVPHLRTSTLPVTRPQRSANGDAVLAYNLKRMINVLGGRRFSLALATS